MGQEISCNGLPPRTSCPTIPALHTLLMKFSRFAYCLFVQLIFFHLSSRFSNDSLFEDESPGPEQQEREVQTRFVWGWARGDFRGLIMT